MTDTILVSDQLPASLLPWIDALAKQAAQDYLRAEAAQQADSSDESTKRVPLPEMDKAA